MNEKDKEIKRFFEVLFNKGEKTNFGLTLKDTSVLSQDAVDVVRLDFERFCINPLHPEKDLRPTQEYHDPDTPRRADCNVVALRNFLVECDKMALKEQYEYIVESGLPYSTCCHSGGKSLHFIVSLVEPTKDLADYKDLAKRIHRVLAEADQQNINPSRTSRFPYHLRRGGEEQCIIDIRRRVSRQELEQWLSENGASKQEAQEIDGTKIARAFHLDTRSSFKILSPWTKQFLIFGAPEGERNRRLFMAACDCAEKGLDIDEAMDVLQPALNHLGSDFSDAEFKATIQSAYNRVHSIVNST